MDEEEALEFSVWLESLEEDDPNSAIDESCFVPVRWVEGIGFVKEGGP